MLEGAFTWQLCPIGLCIGGVVVLQLLQLVPMPMGLLSWVSPSSAWCWTELRPAQLETLPGEVDQIRSGWATISIYPAATRKALTQSLAIFLLYSVVRNNLISTSVLFRLSFVAISNAVLLSLFALIQFFAAKDRMFWMYEVDVPFFGPFICRNHFPFYTNMCVGMALGILLGLWTGKRRKASRDKALTLTLLLNRPDLLWMIAMLGLVVTTGIFSKSRGGFVALLVASLFWAALSSNLVGKRSFGFIFLIALTAFLMLWWVGSAGIGDRLGTLLNDDIAEKDRVPLWLSVARIVPRFPLFGSGGGTFRLIEPLYRRRGSGPNLIWDHAHNDYLEALIEGGFIQLSLIATAVVLIFLSGIRARRWTRDPRRLATILGGLTAFTTVVVHSSFDFGMHIPAIAVLATVIASLLAGMGGAARHPEAVPGQGIATFRLNGVAPWLGALVLCALALVLVGVGRRADLVDRRGGRRRFKVSFPTTILGLCRSAIWRQP